MHQIIFHLSFKKQSYHFRKVKPDNKGRNWLTLSYGAQEWPSSWECLHRDIFRLLPTESLTASTLSRHLARSGIFCLLVEVVCWPCGLKFFYFHSFEWFCLQISSDTNIFSSLVQGFIVVRICYFQIWNKKEHNIIISRIISSHMGLMYNETPNISAYKHKGYQVLPGGKIALYGSHLYWNTLYISTSCSMKISYFVFGVKRLKYFVQLLGSISFYL